MRALIATAYGDVEKLMLADMPEPEVGPNHVKVQVHAASINPLDWKLLSGYGRGTPLELHFPTILGRDVSGEVIEVGTDVTSLRPGDQVLGFASSTFAERVVALETAFARVPPDLDLTEAAALPMVALTGAQLADTVQPRSGMSVLVTGAAGGVGRVAVFIAKTAGATVWAGVRKEQKATAKSLGADHIAAIDDDVELATLPKFDAICDTVDGDTIGKLLPHLHVNSVIGTTLGEPPGARQAGVKVNRIRTQPDSRRLAELAQAAAEGRLAMPVQGTFPLEKAADAFALARQGGAGKVLLLPWNKQVHEVVQ